MNLLKQTLEQKKDLIVEIELELLNPNDLNSIYMLSDIETLSHNIEINGQLEPLQVYLSKGEYTIISGHRRYTALKNIGVEFAKCIVLDKPTSVEEEKVLLVEANSQRVKSKEEIKNEVIYKKSAYKKLKAEGHPKYRNANINKLIAEETGISITSVKNHTKAEEKAQKRLTKPEKLPEIINMENHLSSAFDTEVDIKGNEKGSLIIKYYDKEHLQNIIDIIGLNYK